MDCRKELYLAICETLREKLPDIRHVELWNHNVEFIEQETDWPRPAVFIEFGDLEWRTVVKGQEYRTDDALVRLHVVTDWRGSSARDADTLADALSVFDLGEKICAAVGCLSGENFKRLDWLSSATSHNHEDIIETVETYRYTAFRRYATENEE